MANQIMVTELEIPGVKLIESNTFEDNRGNSTKIFSKAELSECGIDFELLEIMNIHSNKNTLRGIHFQRVYGQSKMISCNRGELLVVAVDIVSDSSTYGKWCSVILDSPQKVIYIPKECAVGSLAIADADFTYICGEYPFMKEYESGIKWDDETLNIDWIDNSAEKIVSIKDASLRAFNEMGKD